MSGPAQVKRVRALHQKKVRLAERLFLVQGRKLVTELLSSPLIIEELFATQEAASYLGDAPVTVLADHELERMGTFEKGNEVVALVRMPAESALRMPAADELVLALDGVSDPGNLGTLLRIADWFGVKQVWCSGDSVDVYNPKCVQATMGSLFRVEVREVELASILERATQAGVQVYKAEASGTDVFTTELSRPAVLVLGSESHGLSAEVKNAPGRSIAIPNFGEAESLNVAAAAAALCMEFARRVR